MADVKGAEHRFKLLRLVGVHVSAIGTTAVRGTAVVDLYLDSTSKVGRVPSVEIPLERLPKDVQRQLAQALSKLEEDVASQLFVTDVSFDLLKAL